MLRAEETNNNTIQQIRMRQSVPGQRGRQRQQQTTSWRKAIGGWLIGCAVCSSIDPRITVIRRESHPCAVIVIRCGIQFERRRALGDATSRLR